MTKPITDEEFNKFCQIVSLCYGTESHMWTWAEGIRERLRLAEAVADSSDKYVNTDWQEIHTLQRLIANYRAATAKKETL